jgi:protein tyrosine phosphatase (PTP) superfamily phosphohydrolase (DUF442 family)
LTTGSQPPGQPTEWQLADIHALGVRHIVNLGLHSHEKTLPDEATSVCNLGTYIHIPVDFQNPTENDFAQFCSVMADLPSSVVIYWMSVLGSTPTHAAIIDTE